MTNEALISGTLTGDTLTEAAPLGDPRPLFDRAVTIGTSVLATVRPEQLDHPTPCTDFDVRRLLGHLVEVLQKVAAIGRGADPFTLSPVSERQVADDGYLDAWLEAAEDVRQAWADDGALTRIVRLPWSVRPGDETLAAYINEVSVHTWDLAVATGQRPVWDQRVLEVALAAITEGLPAGNRIASIEAFRQTMPEEFRSDAAPFGEAVEVPHSAPLIDRLVAWNGRRP